MILSILEFDLESFAFKKIVFCITFIVKNSQNSKTKTTKDIELTKL
jgi:hypothetical protein